MPEAVSVLGLGSAWELAEAIPLAAAAEAWRERAAGLDSEGDPHLAGTGPIAVGGFAFRPERQPGGPWSGFPGVLLRLPALSLARVRGRTFATAATPDAAALLEVTAGFRAPAARHLEVAPARPAAEWTAAVAEAVRRLLAGEAEKVVLAREVLARGDGALGAGAVARSLRSAYPACFTYLLTGSDGTAFAGASPELLIRRSGRSATSQPMAGSIARGRDEAEDDELARRLEGSAKDGAEHALVPRAVAAALEPLSESVELPARPEVVRLTNIQHLATTVRARLSDPAAGALDLAAALHPTPAVGGHPRAAALRLIEELEGMERGWYAGGVGWTDSRGDGEFAVALRCGLLWEDGARLYAGGGVMPDSDPEAELEETEIKLRALLGALAQAR